MNIKDYVIKEESKNVSSLENLSITCISLLIKDIERLEKRIEELEGSVKSIENVFDYH